MIRMKRYILLCIAAWCMVSCNETFPGMIADVQDKDVNSDEVTKDRIPILFSLNEPVYSIETRGMGVLDDSEEGKEKSCQGVYHIFSYLTDNAYYNGPVDYTATPMQDGDGARSPYCLLYDEHAKLTRNTVKYDEEEGVPGGYYPDFYYLEWATPGLTKYYNLSNQNYKYNFFLAYYDDARGINGTTGPSLIRETDRVYADILIDGTQDVISSVANSDERQGKLQGNYYKPLLAEWNDLVYSTYAGHRGIHPQFRVKHELVQLCFKVRGGDQKSENVTLKDILLLNPKTKARFTMAADDTKTVGLDFPDEWNKEQGEWHLPEQIEGSDLRTDIRTLEDGKYRMKFTHIDDEENFTPVGTAFLAAPSETYRIGFVCEDDLGDDDPETSRLFRPVYTISFKDGKFKAGNKYTIRITIYGTNEIKLDFNDPGWLSGPDNGINIDNDHPDDTGSGDYIIIEN